MTLKDLGYNDALEKYRFENGLDQFEVGRVILEHRERYIVKTPSQEFDAELMGSLRFNAEERSDLPAVGDWVAFSEYDEGKALIHAVCPRHSIIERKAVDKLGQTQIIGTNIDYGLIVQSVNRDFNINRLQRYLTICNAAKVEPIIVLSKIDLIDDAALETIKDQIIERIKNVQIITVSSESIGYNQIESIILPGKTYCLLGSSGVGKSTLINHLIGKEKMKTDEISESVNKGKHVTSHRELMVLEDGGILIDNPGMREVGIADTSMGLEMTFDQITVFANSCKYKDCTHIHELGCAVLKALENGEVDDESYTNYQKLKKEKQFFESNAQDRRKKDKELGKMIKKVKKQRKINKF